MVILNPIQDLKLKLKSLNYSELPHWNVNRLLAHNKLLVLEAYHITDKYDAISISESNLGFFFIA